MKDTSRTKADLLEEISGLRSRIVKLEAGNGEDRPDNKNRVAEALQETEAQFLGTVEEGMFPMATLNSDLQLIKFNRAFCEMVGYTKQELQELTLKDITYPDDVQQSLEVMTQVFKGGLPSFQIKSRYLTKSHAIIWCNVAATAVRDIEGKPINILVTVENITDRKRMEEALRDSEIRSRALLEDSPVCTKIIDLDFRLVYMSAAGQKKLKLSDVKSLYGGPYPPDFFPESTRTSLIDHLERAKAGDISSLECAVFDMEGCEVWFHTTFVPVRDDEERIKYILATSVDITERKRAEGTLRAIVKGTAAVTNVDFFHSLLRHLTEALDAPYAFISECVDPTNTRARTLAFLNKGTLIENIEYALEGTPCEGVIAGDVCYYPEGIQRLFPQDADLVDLGVQCYLGLPLQASSGQVIGHLVVMSEHTVRFDSQMESILRIFAARAGAELERKQAEEALRSSELRYRIVARSTHDAIWDWDIIRNSLEWNDGIHTLFGYEPDAIGPDLTWWIENIHPEDRTRVVNEVHAVVDSGESIWTSEYQFRCSDETYAIVADRGYVVHDETGKAIRMAGAMNDITQRKQEEALKFGQQHILELISHGNTSLPDILKAIIHFTEKQFSGVRATILNVKDNRLQHGATLSMPATYIERINGLEIGPNVGSCGTAAYRKERVIVADVATDPLWADHHQLGAAFGFRACWSEPVFDSNGKVLGTFALYHKEPGVPTDTEIQIVETMASVASIAIERKQAENELRDFEIKNRALLEGSSSVCNKIIDLDSRLQYMSATGLRQLKIPDIKSLYGCAYPPDFYSEAMQAPIIEHLERAKAGEISIVECPVLDMEGDEVWYHTTFVPVYDDEERIRYILATSVDITERKQAEFALRQSEDRYRDVLTNIPALVAVVDKNQRYQLINKQYEDFFGLPSDQILGKFIREVVGATHYEQLKEHIEVVLSGKSSSFEMERVPGNGERRRWLDVSYVPDYDQAGEVQGFFALVSDITERRQAQNQLRELSRQLRRAEEVERQKIARELHDEFGQLLTVLKMDLGWLDVALNQDQPVNKATFSDKFSGMSTVLNQAIESVRRVTSFLRPEVLDTLGIFPALESLCRDVQGRTNIACVVSAGSGMPSLVMDDERSHALFRITQEFLTNVVRHANASEVHITISVQGGDMILDLQDNGIGISPDRIHSTTTLGLLGMKERTEMLGGRFTIAGKPGEGTRATVSLPLENQFVKKPS